MKMLVLVLSLSLFACASGQNTSTSHVDTETKGACSPIAPYNHGTITITCTGFPERQTKQILDFLHQLSMKQSRDQEAVLSKLNAIIAAVKETQRQSSPRIITGELRQGIVESNWGVCAPERAFIIAPIGDSEAQNLAGQISSILNSAGVRSNISYDRIEKEQGNAKDFKIATTGMNGYCIARYLGGHLRDHFSVGFEQRDPGALKSKIPQSQNDLVPVYIYVYPR